MTGLSHQETSSNHYRGACSVCISASNVSCVRNIVNTNKIKLFLTNTHMVHISRMESHIAVAAIPPGIINALAVITDVRVKQTLLDVQARHAVAIETIVAHAVVRPARVDTTSVTITTAVGYQTFVVIYRTITTLSSQNSSFDSLQWTYETNLGVAGIFRHDRPFLACNLKCNICVQVEVFKSKI